MNKSQAAERIEAIRRSIRSKELIDALTDHVLGDREMTATQVQAARELLGFDLPKLKAVEHSTGAGGVTVNLVYGNKPADH